MQEQGLGIEALRAACTGAVVRLEGQESGPRRKRPIVVGGTLREEAHGGSDSRERVFVFDRCKSNCNSSRLHMGGRVVVVVTIRGPQGPIAEAVTEPLLLVSKTSYTRRPPAPRIRWVHEAEASGSSDEAAEQPAGGGEQVRRELEALLRLQGEQLERVRTLTRRLAGGST
eukprot:m51a1_g1058 hypothetical protein (171) ;mRNA; f:816716-817567